MKGLLSHARASLPCSLVFSAVLACGGTGDETADGGDEGNLEDDISGDGDDIASSSGGTFGTGGGSGGPAGGEASASGGGSSTGAGGTGQTGPAHVVIVAHQDDDLLFINPDLKRAMDKNEPLSTVYLTSGNAGMEMDYVLERERGIKSAYAFMAGASNSWTCGPQVYAGKAIQTCTLDSEKVVTLHFLRLVDGFGTGTDPQSLRNLWEGNISVSAAVDGSGLSFTREELLASVASLIQTSGATALYTTDFSFEHRNNDHSDHEYAALITLVSSGNHALPHSLSSYLTYGTTSMPSNLSSNDTALVSDVFGYYASCDKELSGCSGGLSCDATTCATDDTLYTSWFSRHYSASRLTPPLNTSLASLAFSGYCVDGGGASVTTSACGAGEPWSWGSNFTLRNSGGLCLTAPSFGSSNQATVATCTGAAAQRWLLMSDGHVVLARAPEAGDSTNYKIAKCLDAGTEPGSSVVVMDCGTDPALDFSF